MKKKIAALLCLALLTGCGKQTMPAAGNTPADTSGAVSEEPDAEASTLAAPATQEAEAPEINTEGAYLVLDAADAYDGAYSFVTEEAGKYSFEAANAEGFEDLSWDVYILDEEFQESTRYLPQAYETNLTVGDGDVDELLVEADQFVYCVCSLNSFTGDKTVGASKLAVRFAPAEMEEDEFADESEDPESLGEVLLDTMDIDAGDGEVFSSGLMLAAEKDGTVTARCNTDAESAEGSVYGLDEPFEDAYRYLRQVYDPVLTGDGTFEVKNGQYVYLWCSVNAYTADDAPEEGAFVLHLELAKG